jgi:Spy/CpxP family protein refolding chaperone
MKNVRSLLVLVVCIAIAGTTLAAEGRPGGRPGPGGPGGRGGFGDPTARIDYMVRGLDLTDAQKAKVEDIKKEFSPKFKEAQEKRDSILTDEQKKTRTEVFQKARESRQGFPNREDLEKALKLTDEQKKKTEEARKVTEELTKTMTDKVTSLLTPEQKEKMEKARAERGNRGGGNRGGQGRTQ